MPDEAYDFVHSSHCLEHLRNPREALMNWMRILKPEGHMVVVIPDEDLYEQDTFPSTKNRDHKWTFTITKNCSWSPRSINLTRLLVDLGSDVQIMRIDLLDGTYRYALPPMDQTQTPVGGCAIEFILRKRTRRDLELKGDRLPVPAQRRPRRAVKLTRSGAIRRRTGKP